MHEKKRSTSLRCLRKFIIKLAIKLSRVVECSWYTKPYKQRLMAMSHGAIFLATCNVILLLGDVNLVNTRLHYILLMYSSHIKQSSLITIS